LRLVAALPSLREARAHARVRNCLVAGAERFGLRVLHYSAQSNHVHLIVEAENESALARGMKGLCVRIAHAVNRAWKRKGRFFADRYHARALVTPTEVRNALRYVLTNAAHHGVRLARGIDPCSSACWFDGWNHKDSAHAAHMRNCPFPRAKSWLITDGWKLLGLLDPLEARASRT
jgi:REP element-mobilizing transposase RayT